MRLLLFCRDRRQELISGIAYMHRIDDDGIKDLEVDRNLRMLSKIAGAQYENVIIVTTGWDKPEPSGVNRAAKKADLKTILKATFKPDQFMRHDGSKWSALRIVNVLKRKNPTPLYIQTQLATNPDPSSTEAAREMLGDINKRLKAKRADDEGIRDQILNATDKARVTTLTKALTQIGVVLGRLMKEGEKLRASVDWDQAARDNVQIEAKIKEQYTLATTDWKAEYDKVKVEAVGILITMPKQISHTQSQF